MKYSLLLFFFLPLTCVSQTDSSYIKPFEQKISVRLFTSKNFLVIEEKANNKKEFTYEPNNPLILGGGLSIRNSVISLSYGYGFNFLRDEKKGKTKSLDFQYHYYGRKFIMDAFIQRYTGFYLSDKKDNLISIHPNLTAKLYGLSGHYILNNKKFSGKAAFNQTEQQLKSAGSFLIGAQVYISKFDSDSPLFDDEKGNFRNFQFGINAGYAYTFVFKRNWTAALSISGGINLGSEEFHNFGQNKVEVYPSVFPRFIAAYNCESWSISVGTTVSILYPVYKNQDISILSGYAGLSFTKRLDLSIPLLDKLKF